MCESENVGFPRNIHALYIQPPDDEGMISGEDEADDESGGLPDDVCAAQLKAGCELVFEDGERLDFEDDGNGGGIETTHITDEELLANILNAPIILTDEGRDMADANIEGPSTSSPVPRKRLCRVKSVSSPIELPNTNKNTKFVWQKETGSSSIPIFPDANYEDCRNLKSYEQFEKFFDDTLLQHISDCSSLYATFRGRCDPKISIAGKHSFVSYIHVRSRFK